MLGNGTWMKLIKRIYTVKSVNIYPIRVIRVLQNVLNIYGKQVMEHR